MKRLVELGEAAQTEVVRGTVPVIAFVLALAPGRAEVHAAPPAPAAVFVYQEGPKAIKVRLSVGKTSPCDSSSNRQIYLGWMQRQEMLEVPFTEACACVEHTYDDFPEVGWSQPILRCRPNVCLNGYCWPDSSIPVHITISSKRPK